MKTGGLIQDRFKKKCNLCKEIIYNRTNGAKYCKEHSEAVMDINRTFGVLKSNLVRKHKNININYVVDVNYIGGIK